MKNSYLLIITVIVLALGSCSRKSTPEESSSRSIYGSGKAGTSATSGAVATKRVKTPVPTVIVVNDSAAKKTFDGRYYYDLEGHRYWRSKKDGKYYIFNKSMATDPDFRSS
ncbi:hypothetical protein BH11BAC4_BH11BAC4_27440 [soil metagenome]